MEREIMKNKILQILGILALNGACVNTIAMEAKYYVNDDKGKPITLHTINGSLSQGIIKSDFIQVTPTLCGNDVQNIDKITNSSGNPEKNADSVVVTFKSKKTVNKTEIEKIKHVLVSPVSLRSIKSYPDMSRLMGKIKSKTDAIYNSHTENFFSRIEEISNRMLAAPAEVEKILRAFYFDNTGIAGGTRKANCLVLSIGKYKERDKERDIIVNANADVLRKYMSASLAEKIQQYIEDKQKRQNLDDDFYNELNDIIAFYNANRENLEKVKQTGRAEFIEGKIYRYDAQNKRCIETNENGSYFKLVADGGIEAYISAENLDVYLTEDIIMSLKSLDLSKVTPAFATKIGTVIASYDILAMLDGQWEETDPEIGGGDTSLKII